MSFLGLVAFCGIVFVASVIQGISGFAFGTVDFILQILYFLLILFFLCLGSRDFVFQIFLGIRRGSR